MINRYSGATPVAYSVAEHSILVCRILQKIGASNFTILQGLLHDAHEAYIGDITTPVKKMIYAVEPLALAIDKVILESLGLPARAMWDADVYAADQQALSLEYYLWFHSTRPVDWGKSVLPKQCCVDVRVPQITNKHVAEKELKTMLMHYWKLTCKDLVGLGQ
jgi:hypothetical protein